MPDHTHHKHPSASSFPRAPLTVLVVGLGFVATAHRRRHNPLLLPQTLHHQRPGVLVLVGVALFVAATRLRPLRRTLLGALLAEVLLIAPRRKLIGLAAVLHMFSGAPGFGAGSASDQLEDQPRDVRVERAGNTFLCGNEPANRSEFVASPEESPNTLGRASGKFPDPGSGREETLRLIAPSILAEQGEQGRMDALGGILVRVVLCMRSRPWYPAVGCNTYLLRPDTIRSDQI